MLDGDKKRGLPLVIVVQTQTSDNASDQWMRRLSQFEVVKYKALTRNSNNAFFDGLFSVRETVGCKGKSVLVILDTSLCLLPDDAFRDKLLKLMYSDVDYDLFYLCKWQDSVQRYKEIKEISSDGTMYFTTTSPSGLQAIMFSPKALDVIYGYNHLPDGRLFNCSTDIMDLDNQLRNEIFIGNFHAVTTIPNIVDVNPSLMKTASEYAKLQLATNSEQVQDQSVSNTSIYIWFAIVTILIIVLAWFVIEIGSRN